MMMMIGGGGDGDDDGDGGNDDHDHDDSPPPFALNISFFTFKKSSAHQEGEVHFLYLKQIIPY